MKLDRAWISVAALVVSTMLVGCKSGTSFTKPSWWSFGGSGAGDAEKLAAAPPYGDAAKAADGSIQKPSASATPYPTTTTPQGYVVSGTGGAQVAAAAAAPAMPDAPITYGKSAPQPAIAATAAPPAAPAASPPAAPIGTQAGPYAALPAPPAASPPPVAAAPAVAERTPDAAPQSRFATVGGPESQAGPPSTPPSSLPFGSAPESSAGTDPRYGSVSGSRFAQEPPPFSAGRSAELPPATPLGASPAAVPAATVPGAPPTRRPDPGYRPGGTSSYRPSKTILVGDPAPESAVRTAAFETPAEPIRQ